MPSTSSSSREGPRLAQSSDYQMGREVLLALRARHTLPGLAVHLCRSACPSQVPNKIIWETAQLIFKLLQKQLFKIFPTKIKTFLSQKSLLFRQLQARPKAQISLVDTDSRELLNTCRPEEIGCTKCHQFCVHPLVSETHPPWGSLTSKCLTHPQCNS